MIKDVLARIIADLQAGRTPSLTPTDFPCFSAQATEGNSHVDPSYLDVIAAGLTADDIPTFERALRAMDEGDLAWLGFKIVYDVDEAQRNKMDLICRKLDLKEGMSVLDIGCGWGGLSLYLAKEYGVKVTGVTISTEQLAYAREHDAGHLVNWLLQDYRSMEGQFDRIVSVGMFEHVGRKNYDIFMKTTKRLLKPSGLFLLHTIGNSKKKTGTDPWINKYIFPNGMLPSPVCVAKAITGLYVMEDWHNFGADYDKTLMAWHQRFEEGYAEGAFQCSERVRRMYRYYLLSCAGAFRARDIQLWQIVLSPEGVEGGYCCQR